MPRRTVVIEKNDAGQRLDKFLTKAYPNLPQAVLYKCIRTKDVSATASAANGTTAWPRGMCSPCTGRRSSSRRSQRNTTLKSPQQAVHRLRGREPAAAGQAARAHRPPGRALPLRLPYRPGAALPLRQGEYDPDGEQSFAPALVNRIDRNTGGIVMAAKNAEALRVLNQKVKDRELRKLYLCVVCGRLERKEGLLTGYLEKNEAQNRVYISKKPKEGARTIRTKYRVLEERRDFSLLEVELLTGRTHQIRAHFASIGHPLAGDGKYGKNTVNKGTGFPYQALYSYKLGFDFTTEAGILAYLNGREFAVQDVWFLPEFRAFPRS